MANTQQAEIPQDILPTIPNKSSSAPKYTPIADIFDLIAVKGLTYEEAGKILGMAKNSVWERCQRAGIPSKNTVARFKQHRADAFAAKQMMMIDTLTVDEIKEKMSPYQRIVGASILYDKERLERDKSTQNVILKEISDNINDLDREIAQIQGADTEESGDDLDTIEAELKALGVDDA